MQSRLLTIILFGASLFAAQEQRNRFDENVKDEVVVSQSGPGNDTPGGDLEDDDTVPIDQNSGWLAVIAIGVIIYHTANKKKSVCK